MALAIEHAIGLARIVHLVDCLTHASCFFGMMQRSNKCRESRARPFAALKLGRTSCAEKRRGTPLSSVPLQFRQIVLVARVAAQKWKLMPPLTCCTFRSIAAGLPPSVTFFDPKPR